MLTTTKLTKREFQIVQAVAYGASRKDVPDCLPGRQITVSTVDNTLRKVYIKLKVQSLNALAAWYFVNIHGVSTDDCPMVLRRRISAAVLLGIFCFTLYGGQLDNIRRPQSSTRVQRLSARRTSRKDNTYLLI